MNSTRQKNRSEVNIETWNINQIDNFISKDLPEYIIYGVNEDSIKLEGYKLLRANLVREWKSSDKKNVYAKATDLSPLEVQSEMGLDKMDYDRAIIASKDDFVIGFLMCRWIKYSSNYWHYFLSFLEVHEGFKNQGIGTDLIKTLDKASFIKNKILLIGDFEPEGEKYIKSVMKREIKAEDYALVYSSYIGPQPSSFGIYEGEHWDKLYPTK